MEVASTAAVRLSRARVVALRTVAGLCVGAVLSAIFVRLVNVGGVVRRLVHLRLGFALLCGVAFLAAYVVRALRWRVLLRPDEVSVGRVTAIYQVATFLNWLLPIQGGELAKSLLLRSSNGIPVSRSLATVSMDKAMDLLPAVGLLALMPFVPLHLSRPLWVLLLLAVAVIALAALAIASAAWARGHGLAPIGGRLAAAVPRSARKRIEPVVEIFIDSLVGLIRRPCTLLVAAAYTAVAVCLDALFCFLAFRAVGVAVAPHVALLGYALFNLAFILPTPPGHVGSNELVGLLIFGGVFGVDRSGVGAMFLFSHPWTAILMTSSGLTCSSLLSVRLRSAWRMIGDLGGKE